LEANSTKLSELQTILADLGGVLVAFSGGVDSTFLLRMALDTLGDKVLAVTARTGLIPDSEIACAKATARRMRARHVVVSIDALADPTIASNAANRCYVCKRAIFAELGAIATDRGLHVIDGSNCDDLGDYRPGLKALQEAGVRSPLAEAGLTKSEIRALSRERHIETWDRPASPCLATRFPYGERLTPQRLKRVEQAEAFLHSLGFKIVRVRAHGSLARIEVSREDVARLAMQMAPTIVAELKALGYAHVSLDLEGYRSGSMDEAKENRATR